VTEGAHVAIQQHTPVMAREVVRALNIRDGGTYVDATFGRGGHTRAILDCLSSKGRVLAIDRDPDSCSAAYKLFPAETRLTVLHHPFSNLSQVLHEFNLNHSVIGIVIDLGVSSTQLDQPKRGFSFLRHGPLDMRMDPTIGETAADWLDRVEEKDLYHVLRELGEERFAGRIARQVIRQRKMMPIRTTEMLSNLVTDVVPTRERGKHPATRSFQAIRMHINQELDELESLLPQALDGLAAGGRLIVISFHSLEDRLVKLFMRKGASGDSYPPDLPITHDLIRPTLKIIGKPLRPTAQEVTANPRSRSAILRVAEKLEFTT
jgi:16S rRNA (cytosine1402-N4)-methyltransferase